MIILKTMQLGKHWFDIISPLPGTRPEKWYLMGNYNLLVFYNNIHNILLSVWYVIMFLDIEMPWQHNAMQILYIYQVSLKCYWNTSTSKRYGQKVDRHKNGMILKTELTLPNHNLKSLAYLSSVFVRNSSNIYVLLLVMIMLTTHIIVQATFLFDQHIN